MPGEIGSFLVGIVFGLALAVPPGPMNAIIAEQSVTRNWSAGFAAGLGAALADVIFFVLAVVGAAAVIESVDILEPLLLLLGGGLMLVFAVDAVRSGLREDALQRDGETVTNATGFQKALVLGLTNPYQLAFWLTVGIGLVSPGTIDLGEYVPLITEFVVETGSVALLGGFFTGIGLWIVSFPATLVVIGRRVDAFAPVVAAGSALVLGGFGVIFAYSGLTGLF